MSVVRGLHDFIVPLLCNVNPFRLHAIDLR